MKNLSFTEIPIEELKQVLSDTIRTEIGKYNFSTPPETELITRIETATILGVSLPTLNEWTKNGVIPCYRINTRIRFKKHEILDAVNNCKTIKYRRAE